MTLTEVFIAMAIWVLGFGQQGQANQVWRDHVVDPYLPPQCELWEDGSGQCAVTDCMELVLPGFDDRHEATGDPVTPYIVDWCEGDERPPLPWEPGYEAARRQAYGRSFTT